jgi:hypothetical protein
MTFYSGLILVTIFAITFFISERKLENEDLPPSEKMTPRKVLLQIPVYLKNQRVRKFLYYIMLTRSFESFINEPTKLKMIEFGVKKSTFVNLYGLVIPLEIFLSVLSKKYLVKGKMVQFYHYFLTLVGNLSFTFRRFDHSQVPDQHLLKGQRV